ncbi:DUF5916 domain-containing protein [Pontimicrobium aquaticum]|uniref:Hydrolase n=1 Tax=Pontimicrobium aquaticum TaxID=2565367 RepID=A0A4U0EWP6_9FLAO|nr:DUF5916 domain-containing protein [Pontimicrobium aquaticum]TJY36353.1 hydrolase [Pontimicrobium aquaticum]
MKNTFLLLALFSFFIGYSQNKSFVVKYIDSPIILDGNLDESVWSEAESATNFWQYFPTDSLQATQQADIKMLFDDTNLYIGMKVNAPSNNFVIPSLRRDFRAGGSDNITLMFDTFNDGTNAFIFGTNPAGVQREILLSGGGNELRGFNTAWDTKWRSETVVHDNYYIVEWIIPFSAFKYREGETKWRFNSYHFDTQANERNTWMQIPQNQPIFSLAYMGDMIFEKPLGNSKTPISIIPYVNGLVGKDYENGSTTEDFKYGGDAKMTIGNSMNLDLTVNPDFSQVEVDQQVTNLTRFEVSLPERRQFFIENSDLFADFGNDRDANPFFSRRIGIAKDADDNSIENDIIAGARLSGKVSNNLRLGILNMQTAEDLANEIPATNNAVITAQHKLFSRSNISFMFINKQATKDYDFLANEDRYNRVFGIDYRLASEDNTWIGKYFFHKSFSPDTSGKDLSSGATTEYNSRNWNFRFGAVYVGDNFRSDLGFIRRTDVFKISPRVERVFWPKTGVIQKHSLSVMPFFLWRPELDFEKSDHTIVTSWNAELKNTSNIEFQMYNRFTHLYDSFDPTRTDDGTPLPGNEDYYYTSFEASYRSDQRKALSYNISPSFGQFYNGKKYSIGGMLSWRLQPYFLTSVQINYDKINLPNPYPDASIWLIGPKFDVTFNKNLFWATFIQYSSQRDNFSINTRLQWRFAPLSDLFVVYNDNYFTDNVFAPRVRSFNVKLTYWINI